jgi:hypothetical protein
MKIRRKTRKRGGMVPRRISSRNSSSQPPSGIAPPPSYNGLPPSFNNISSQPSNRRQPVNHLPVSSNAVLSSRSSIATSSNSPPAFNVSLSSEPILPPYKPNSREMGTGTNKPISHNMATGTNKPISHNMATGTNTPESAVMQTQTNRASVSNIETQTNNNNGRNIPTMTEDELLQQYTSVYEKITSKEDAVESAALLKPHLKTIKNPIAFYILADVNSKNDGWLRWKTADLHAHIITRTNVHSIHSTFKGWPTDSWGSRASMTQGTVIKEELAIAWGFTNRKDINTLSFYPGYQFKKPLDSRLIHMFQTISKNPSIGQTDTTTSSMPGCGTSTTGASALAPGGLFMAVCWAL